MDAFLRWKSGQAPNNEIETYDVWDNVKLRKFLIHSYWIFIGSQSATHQTHARIYILIKMHPYK